MQARGIPRLLFWKHKWFGDSSNTSRVEEIVEVFDGIGDVMPKIERI